MPEGRCAAALSPSPVAEVVNVAKSDQMPETVLPTPEALLRLCAAAAPEPWYPKVYAQTSGVPRDSLDVPLNELRLASLVRLTEWQKDRSQGYALTDSGHEVLNNPALLAKFRAGIPLPLAKPLPVEPPLSTGGTTPLERGEKAIKSLYEPEPPRMAPVLIVINLVVYILSFIDALRRGVPVDIFVSTGDVTSLHNLARCVPSICSTASGGV